MVSHPRHPRLVQVASATRPPAPCRALRPSPRRVVAELVRRFGPATDFKLTFSIGGQIGIDVCPCGWDKTFCLQFLPTEAFDAIHFFGDKTHEGAQTLSLAVRCTSPQLATPTAQRSPLNSQLSHRNLA